MIRSIVHDPAFLSRPSQPVEQEDSFLAQDLMDTLTVHRASCVGMAANMIGFSKRAIIFDNNGKYTVLFNPVIIRCADPYETTEGCLSIPGTKTVTRYRSIRLEYDTTDFQHRQKTFTGRTAQINQHEIDHCNGILI